MNSRVYRKQLWMDTARVETPWRNSFMDWLYYVNDSEKGLWNSMANALNFQARVGKAGRSKSTAESTLSEQGPGQHWLASRQPRIPTLLLHPFSVDRIFLPLCTVNFIKRKRALYLLSLPSFHADREREKKRKFFLVMFVCDKDTLLCCIFRALKSRFVQMVWSPL